MKKSKAYNAIHYYKVCTTLKNIIRKGPTIWNAKRSRIESIAEHIYGVQMLAIAVYYEFNYKIDLLKTLYMLAVHELAEIEMGDLAFFEITADEKRKKGEEAAHILLDGFMGEESIIELLKEFSEKKTKEAKFAYYCDKLENDIQMKLYDQEGCFDINDQPNNPILDYPNVKKVIESEKNISNAWLEFDRDKFSNNKVFIELLDYLKENDI